MTELRSVACLLSAASARFVRSSHTATGSAASSTAIRSPVSTEERMCREVVLFSMAAIPIHQRRLRDAFIGGGACKALPACCRAATSCRLGGHGASTPLRPTKLDCFVAASRNDGDKRYFGCGTIRIYGFGAFQPCG